MRSSRRSAVLVAVALLLASCASDGGGGATPAGDGSAVSDEPVLRIEGDAAGELILFDLKASH